jgi:hypothetical protein
MPRVKLAAQDLLVPKEGILDAALPMIASFLLPLSASQRVHFEHRLVSR